MKPEREDNTLIYLDYAASAPPYEEAMQDMLRTALSQFANPGAVHAAGAQARSILHAARRTLAECLNVRPQETAARESVRFSPGRLTTEQEIARTVQAVGEIMNRVV